MGLSTSYSVFRNREPKREHETKRRAGDRRSVLGIYDVLAFSRLLLPAPSSFCSPSRIRRLKREVPPSTP